MEHKHSEQDEAHIMASKVFYILLVGCILFMIAAYVFAINH